MSKSSTSKMCAVRCDSSDWQYYNKLEKFLIDSSDSFLSTVDFFEGKEVQDNIFLLAPYKVIAFFHRDPLESLYPIEHALAVKIHDYCKREEKIMANTPDILSKSKKSLQLALLKNQGFSVSNCIAFADPSDIETAELEYPIFVRYDAGHDSYGESVQGPFRNFHEFVKNFRPSTFESKPHFKDVIAIEWIDTKFSDGHYRRYRAFSTQLGAYPGNLHISTNWYIHGDDSLNGFEKEQEEFGNQEYSVKEKELFTSIIRSLGLYFGAIDYSYRPNGSIVIWEVNPHPALPNWTENEPTRSRIVELFVNQYSHLLGQT